jgi:hypothetical protein
MKNNYSTLTNTYNSNQCIGNCEVFYYNTGDPNDSNSGFNQVDVHFPTSFGGYTIANSQQILDACKSGLLMPSGWYAWGLGSSGWPAVWPAVLFSGSGHQVISRDDHQKYGVFCYGVKPLKTSIGNCLTNADNVVCVLPWSYVSDKWSQYDKSTPAGV